MKLKSADMLIDQISSFENLERAFKNCSRGKRNTIGYMKSLFPIGEKLIEISKKLSSDTYQWGSYREFLVKDPKERLVMAAPFIDRIVHHAIHQIIEPICDEQISDSVFACRHGRGNRAAVIEAYKVLQAYGEKRYVVKLDVTKYFPSINHNILMERLQKVLPDDSISRLLWSLLKSHPLYAETGHGIPIGNLTSQLFANFYLLSVDRMALDGLGCSFKRTKEKPVFDSGHYIRYMDDCVLIGRDKSQVLDTVSKILLHVREDLKLSMSYKKVTHLAGDPIPFLGFLIDHKSYSIPEKHFQFF